LIFFDFINFKNLLTKWQFICYNTQVINKRGEIMRKDIHPNLHDVTFVCACGETFVGTSTKNGDTIKIEICNKCHPFFTGKQKVVDASGRVEKFKQKFNV